MGTVADDDKDGLREPPKKPKIIAVLGSSVAAGWVTSHKSRYDMKNGYAGRLARYLAPHGYSVKNISVPGNATADILERMAADLIPLDADYVIIGLSMANEGLEEGNPDEIFAKYRDGLKKIIAMCREHGMVPILGSCYPYNDYTEQHYECIKKMNLLTAAWDLPGINLLGASDNGSGRFPEDFTYDLGHPNNRGHEEMFYAIVPSLFDALESGKPPPEKAAGTGFVTIEKTAHAAPLTFIPDSIVHSFAVGFELRTAQSGAVAAIRAGEIDSTIEINGAGKLVYRSSAGAAITGANRLSDNEWHHVVLSHRHFKGETLLFVDGVLTGTAAERLEPRQFILGGPGTKRGNDAPHRADYRDWMIFRSALNANDAHRLKKGALLHPSLEVYAPLREDSLKAGKPVENLAQSLARVVAYPSGSDIALDRIEKLIAAAADARAAEPVFPEKEPVAVDTAVYDAYIGSYQVAPGFNLAITRKGDRLFVNPNGEGNAELYPESPTKFFIKFPLDEITVTFEKDESGRVSGLTFMVGGRDNPAKRLPDREE